MVDSVSISLTSAIVYGISGGLFFLLIFLLILIGLCNCNCDNYSCWTCKKKKTRHGRRVGSCNPSQPPSQTSVSGVGALPEYGDQCEGLFVITL